MDIFEKKALPVAESVASRIACLPLYNSLHRLEIEQICRIIIEGE
jgi:dTDP-4-amino-4,6-dideoxygalactose transaminase